MSKQTRSGRPLRRATSAAAAAPPAGPERTVKAAWRGRERGGGEAAAGLHDPRLGQAGRRAARASSRRR